MALHDAVGPASAVVRALAGEVDRQSKETAARWPDSVPDVVAAEARLAVGVAALEGEPLLNGPALLYSGRALGAAVEAADHAVSQTMLDIVARLETLDFRSLDDLADLAHAGAWEAVLPLASTLDLDEYALVSVVDYAARPALVAAAARVAHLLTSVDRVSAHCPICGSPPVLAELSGKDGARSLRCARCGTRWRYPRLACVWCGEQNADVLSALHGEGDAGVRQADCCDRCHGYLKAIAVLDPLNYVALLETDLETAGLDLAAVERGYGRGNRQRVDRIADNACAIDRPLIG
jgi:formate dehydrogenase accessory protein FdhE